MPSRISSSTEADDRGRRAIDIAISLVGLLALSPVFLLVALLIKLTGRGPVFHRSRRAGREGREFRLYKFRSMVPRAAERGPGITRQGDPRVTALGRVLRRTKLDELPQLLNVLRGDMSLVGPRPEDPRYVALYTPEQRKLLEARPGITSEASLTFRHEEELLASTDWEEKYREELLPLKLAIDLAYLSRRTLLSDVKLIVRTARTVFH